MDVVTAFESLMIPPDNTFAKLLRLKMDTTAFENLSLLTMDIERKQNALLLKTDIERNRLKPVVPDKECHTFSHGPLYQRHCSSFCPEGVSTVPSCTAEKALHVV